MSKMKREYTLADAIDAIATCPVEKGIANGHGDKLALVFRDFARLAQDILRQLDQIINELEEREMKDPVVFTKLTASIDLEDPFVKANAYDFLKMVVMTAEHSLDPSDEAKKTAGLNHTRDLMDRRAKYEKERAN